MKSKTWVKRIYNLMEVVPSDFSDFDKMSKEEIDIIWLMISGFFNELGDYEDTINEKIRKYN